MNAEELLVATRELIDEIKPHDFSEASLIGYLNREQEAQAADIVTLQPTVLERFVDVDFTLGADIGNARTLDWPENLIGADALEDVRTIDAPVPVEQIYVHDRWKAERLSWFSFQKKLGLAPKSAIPTGASVRIWGAFLPPRLTVGAFAAAQAAGDSVATLPAGAPGLSLQNDHYNGGQIEVVSGAAVGTRRTIKDYGGSTRVITLETTWGTALTTDDRFAMVPTFPEPHHEVLAFGAALRAAFREANSDVFRMTRAHYQDLTGRLKKSLSLSKQSRPRRVRDLGWMGHATQ